MDEVRFDRVIVSGYKEIFDFHYNSSKKLLEEKIKTLNFIRDFYEDIKNLSMEGINKCNRFLDSNSLQDSSNLRRDFTRLFGKIKEDYDKICFHSEKIFEFYESSINRIKESKIAHLSSLN